MSFLAPLYFLGGLAIIGPILFHLIRRKPKSEVEFSSIMFLDATPPRLTRRSRLENLPLLLMRCAAIAMLAFAFARPFLPLSESETVSANQQAVILLIDQSASMQQTGLWQRAVQTAQNVIDELDSNAIVSVTAFDAGPDVKLSLRESFELDSANRVAAAKDAIDDLEPTWNRTDIGLALRTAADQAIQLNSDGNPDGGVAAIETRIVLISDFQSGAEIDSLQGYDWPDDVWVDLKPAVNPNTDLAGTGNATLRVLPQPFVVGVDQRSQRSRQSSVRVQVTQAADGAQSTFRVQLDGQDTEAASVIVPPGQSRFVSVQLPDSDEVLGQDSERRRATIRLLGDRNGFDNQFFFVRPERLRQTVVFASAKPIPTSADTDAVRQRLDFYVRQIPWSDSTRDIDFVVQDGYEKASDWDPRQIPFVVASVSPEIGDHLNEIKSYLDRGGRVLLVIDEPLSEAGLGVLKTLLESPALSILPESKDEYRLISAVDFESRLIAPLSEPGVNDFSTIRVWNHVGLGEVDSANKTILRLDDGSPWLLERDFMPKSADGFAGQLWVLTSGWQPEQSQFALSTKFVPILLGMLGLNRQQTPDSILVGDQLPTEPTSDKDASDAKEAVAIATSPGFETLDDGSTIAVNLDPRESETSVMETDRISDLGVTVASTRSRQEERTAKRALRDVELESRQGWWQWLILGTLGLIAAETIFSARNERHTADASVTSE